MAATLPSAKDLGVVGVQPGLGVATYRGATGNEGDAAHGMLYASKEIGAVAQRLDKAQEEFDAIQAEDRFNQYQEKLNQLANDPNDGWRTAKGENAIKPEFVQKYTEQFEEERKRVTETLGTANAKRRFGQLSASAALRNRAALYAHSADERVQYEAKVANDSLTLVKENAWRSFGNDQLFEAELARGRAITESFAKRMGMSGESVALAVQKFDSALWSARIQGALDSGDAAMAKELFGKATGSLTTDDKLKLDAKIKPMLRLAETIAGVDKVHAELLPKDLNAPVPTVQIDAKLREMYANDPEKLRVARAESDYRIRSHNLAQAESNKANIGAVMQKLYEQNQPLSAVMRTKEYQALDGDVKARVVLQQEQVSAAREGRAAAAANRALSNEQRAALAQEREGERALLQYKLNPEVVAKMDDNAIREIALTAGPKAAYELMQYKKQLDKPEKVIAARMDAQTFKGIIDDYGYNPQLLTSRKELKGKDREQFDELQEIYRNVNQRIQAKAIESKKQPTQEEKEQIMRDELSKVVKIKNGWFTSDREVPVAAIPSTGERATDLRSRAYVPAETLDSSTLSEAAAFIRSNRAGFANKTDSQIMTAAKKDIERAMALKRMGASPIEVQNALKGVSP